MPRLGQANEPPRRVASLAFSRTPRVNVRNVCLALIVVFILRNFLFNDYRREEMKYLEASGMSQDEIARFVPKTPEEREEYVKNRGNDIDRMKKDIAFLLTEVHQLKAQLHPAESQEDGRNSGFAEMDNIHLQKRKAREEQLLKEHPDFKPGNRLRKAES